MERYASTCFAVGGSIPPQRAELKFRPYEFLFCRRCHSRFALLKARV